MLRKRRSTLYHTLRAVVTGCASTFQFVRQILVFSQQSGVLSFGKILELAEPIGQVYEIAGRGGNVQIDQCNTGSAKFRQCPQVQSGRATYLPQRDAIHCGHGVDKPNSAEMQITRCMHCRVREDIVHSLQACFQSNRCMCYCNMQIYLPIQVRCCGLFCGTPRLPAHDVDGDAESTNRPERLYPPSPFRGIESFLKPKEYQVETQSTENQQKQYGRTVQEAEKFFHGAILA